MTVVALMMALIMTMGAVTMILTVMMVGDHVDKQLVVKMQVVVKALGAVKLVTLKPRAVNKTLTLVAVKIMAAAARMVVLTIKAAATTRKMIASKLVV